MLNTTVVEYYNFQVSKIEKSVKLKYNLDTKQPLLVQKLSKIV